MGVVGDLDGVTGKTSVDAQPTRYMQVQEVEEAAYWIATTAIATGNAKSMLSLFNGDSTKVVKIHAIWVINAATGGVTGGNSGFDLLRFTSHSGGTTLVQGSNNGSGMIHPYDTADTLDTDISVRTGATITGEAAGMVNRKIFSDDEVLPDAVIDVEVYEHGWQQCVPFYARQPGLKPLMLRPSEGLHIKHPGSNTAGSFYLSALISVVG